MSALGPLGRLVVSSFDIENSIGLKRVNSYCIAADDRVSNINYTMKGHILDFFELVCLICHVSNKIVLDVAVYKLTKIHKNS